MEADTVFCPVPAFMQRAIEVARRGGGAVHPNPLVGAVIAKDGRIITEGFHHAFGMLHAERDALENARSRNADVRGAVLYVTLEPCCHDGKQPPCTQAVIDAGIKDVVIGSRDPNPLVNGKGAQQLKKAGITVVQDFMKDECDALNAAFFHFIQTGRPLVTVKYAMSADGKTALSCGESKWISNEESRAHVHFLRGTTAAVMCGVQTVLSDNPLLTCRLHSDDSGGIALKQPVRVVLDTGLRIPPDCNLVKTARDFPLIVFTSCAGSRKAAELEAKGAAVVRAEKSAESRLDLEAVLAELGKRGIDSVLVESGGALNASLFFSGAEKKCLVNKVLCFVAPKIAGGKKGRVHSPVQGDECESLLSCVKLSAPRVQMFGSDVLLSYDVLEENLCSPE